MPGLVGYVWDNTEHTEQLLQAMSNRLEPVDRFQRDLHEEACLGLGRISLGILNPAPQPVWNEAGSVGLILEGEFFDTTGARRLAEAHGSCLRDAGDAELALRMYELFGEDFAARLHGAFTIAIWDRRQAKLVITNDRLGLYPLYYAQVSGGLLFASGVRALLAYAGLPRAIDAAAVAQFLTFDHVLDDHTLLQAAKLLPQAITLAYTGGALSLRHYWTPAYADVFPFRKETEYLEELRELIKQAVARQAVDNLSKGVLLSGGVDSRVILANLSQLELAADLHTFTWGIPGSDDARFAAMLARVAGARHHFYELKPDWLLQQADEAVRLTDGHGNVCNLHALALAEEEGREAQVIYKGFMGDAMMGFAIRRRFFADYTETDLIEAHLQSYREQGLFDFDLPEHPGLFTPEFYEAVGDAILRPLHDGMLRSGSRTMSGQRLFFDMTQRVPRMTINGVEVVRGHAVVRLPFSDYDLWDFTMRVPPGYLFERYLYNRTFAATFPRFAKVPVAQTGLPMITCAREVFTRGWKFAQWHLRSSGLGALAGPINRPFKDYGNWFRTVLRPWVQDTLLSRQALERGIFRPERVRQVVTEHMDGVNHTVQLGALLSLELWHRQTIDRAQ